MKKIHVLLAVFISMTSLSLSCIPQAYAEQGHVVLEYVVSKPQVNVGEEFSVATYVTGRDATQFGSATLSVEAWYPGDSNPKGYEFVRFDPAGSDFPISNGQGVASGAYNYQCRYINRQAATDMTGRHLVGRSVYRALQPATYMFSPASPCRNVVESLSGNWSITWDYSAGQVTITKPAQPATSTPTSAGSAASSSSSSAQSSASGPKNTRPSTAATHDTAVQGAEAVTSSDGNQDKQSTKQTAHTFAAAEERADKSWALLAIIASILLPPAILVVRKRSAKPHISRV